MSPTKMAICWVMRKEAIVRPKRMPKYFPRSPVSILSATKIIGGAPRGAGAGGGRESADAAEREGDDVLREGVDVRGPGPPAFEALEDRAAMLVEEALSHDA